MKVRDNIKNRKVAAKQRCVACERTGKKMNKEHFFPKWLIKKCKITSVGINWGGKRGINPMHATIPLCVDCNSLLGAKIEGPIISIFEDLNNGKGLSRNECGLLVRWLWKFESLMWCCQNPEGIYSEKYSPIDRILGRGFDELNGNLCFAIGIVKDPVEQNDLPMGIDSPLGSRNAIFVSGVFENVAMFAFLKNSEYLVPSEYYSVFQFEASFSEPDSKIFFPKIGFDSYDKAVYVTSNLSDRLAEFHESWIEQNWQLPTTALIVPKARIELPAKYFRKLF